MREILFRGKRLDTGEWVYWTGLGRFTVTQRGKLISGKEGLTDWAYELLTGPNTVGQFTGMVDRNCKRIFEGDICQIKNHRLITDTQFVVEWEDFVYNGWTWRDLDEDGAVDSFTAGAANYCEVIGNIHDNPELIGGGEA